MMRLEKNMTQAKILQNGKIIPLKNYGDINRDLSKEIYEGIDYVCGFDDCGRIKVRFPEQYAKIEADARAEFERSKAEEIKNASTDEFKKMAQEREYRGPDKWQIVRKLAEIIKVETYYGDEYEENSTLSFSLMNNESIFPMDVRGHKEIYQIDRYVSDEEKDTMRIVAYNREIRAIEIKDKNAVVDTIKLDGLFDKLAKQYKAKRESQVSGADLIFDTPKYRVILESVSFNNPDYKSTEKNAWNYGYVSGYILVK